MVAAEGVWRDEDEARQSFEVRRGCHMRRITRVWTHYPGIWMVEGVMGQTSSRVNRVLTSHVGSGVIPRVKYGNKLVILNLSCGHDDSFLLLYPLDFDASNVWREK